MTAAKPRAGAHPLVECVRKHREYNTLSYILTYTGRKFYPLSPDAADVYIEDIAHALSNQCRFTGHTREFMSVAQHSVIVANQLRGDSTLALIGLLHDAPEAYLADVATPIKHALHGYEEIEAGLWCAIASRFDLPAHRLPDVKRADLRSLATERRDLMQYNADPWPILVGIKPLQPRITPLPAKDAKKLFLDTFCELSDLRTKR